MYLIEKQYRSALRQYFSGISAAVLLRSVLLWAGSPPSCVLSDPSAFSPQLDSCYLYSSALAVRRASSWKKILGGIMILLFGSLTTIF